MRVKQIVALVLARVVAVPLLPAQSAASNEINIASPPYIPNENGAIRVQSAIVAVFTSSLFNMQGRFLAGVETLMEMNLKGATIPRYSAAICG